MASLLFNSSLNFKYSTLEKATRGFSNVNKLGQGGFGTVYKVIHMPCVCKHDFAWKNNLLNYKTGIKKKN